MNECVWIVIAFVAITLLVLYIYYLVSLHGRVRRLEHSASPHLEIIEREIHGIGSYVRIIVYIAIFFCVCICVHYLAYCYPHFIPPKNTGFDYMGVIIAVLSAIITLVVGWTIYSTIKAKDELDNAVKTIKEQYDRDIAIMKTDIKRLTKSDIDREIEQAEQKGIEQANEVDKGFVEINLSQEVISVVENQMQVQGTMLYAWAWNVADEYKTFKQIFEEFKSVQRKHPKRVAYIGGNQATDEKAVEVIKEARDSKLKMLASIRAMRQDTDKKNGDS